MNGEEILREEIAKALRDQLLNQSAPPGQVVDADPERAAREVISRFKQRMTVIDNPETETGALAAQLLCSLGYHDEPALRALYGDDRLVACYMILQDKVPPAWTTPEFRAKLAEKNPTDPSDVRSPFDE